MTVEIRSPRWLDAHWLKADIQAALTRDGLFQLWNAMVRNGEIAVKEDGVVLNAAGVAARKGQS